LINFNSILSEATAQSIINDIQNNFGIVNIILQEFNRQPIEDNKENNNSNVQIYEVTEEEIGSGKKILMKRGLMDYVLRFLSIFKSFSNFIIRGSRKKSSKVNGIVVEPDDSPGNCDFVQISKLVALSAFGIALIRSFENVHQVAPFVTFLEEYVYSCLKNENSNC